MTRNTVITVWTRRKIRSRIPDFNSAQPLGFPCHLEFATNRIKTALVCALAYRPKLLVLDEPFSGLDPLVRKEFMETVLSETEGTTILISSHELAELEHTASHVAFMNCGKVVFQDSMDAVTARVRKVHVSLEQPATIPENSPREWLDVHTAGSMLSFIDPQFTEIGSTRKILDT